MDDNIILEMLIENLSEEEAKEMEAAIREICERHGIDIIKLKTIMKED